VAALSLSTTANAGDGKAVGAGLLGFGVGAIVGSAIAPREVYVAPPAPPPPPAYYGPAAYGPPAWSPAWYQYCRSRYGPGFDPQSATSKVLTAPGTFAARSLKSYIATCVAG
jgi:hypothetical protein